MIHLSLPGGVPTCCSSFLLLLQLKTKPENESRDAEISPTLMIHPTVSFVKTDSTKAEIKHFFTRRE